MSESKDNASEKFVIVQATDLFPDATSVLEHGIVFAHRSQGDLITLHVSGDLSEHPLSDPEAVLRNWSQEELGIDHHSVVCRIDDKPKKGLLESLEANDADFLILGTRQQTGKTKKFGESISEAVAIDASMPTLVLHLGTRGLVSDEGELDLNRILLPVGDGEEARDAIRGLTETLDRLKVTDVDIFLLRVGDDEIIDHLTIPERDGWQWHREKRQGYVSNVIGEVCEQKDIDLIVMSTRGKDGLIDAFSGTHTQKVIRRVPRPLLVIPMK